MLFLDRSVRLDSMPNKTEHLDWKLFWLSLAKKNILTLLPMAFYDFLRYGGGGWGDFYPTPLKTVLKLFDWF